MVGLIAIQPLIQGKASNGMVLSVRLDARESSIASAKPRVKEDRPKPSR
jgi:hypothetical protein